ncbi:MAG: polynucleotide kinase-phosphatase [Myxococcales bacterium]|nr:polynucleotide kinase-phosphatase [Myxococcales bacterium]
MSEVESPNPASPVAQEPTERTSKRGRTFDPNVRIPALSLVVIVGPSGSGKSTFARKHFRATEIISSDTCRGLVSDDENDQKVSGDAFELVRFIASKRLALGRLTVIDATSIRAEDRRSLVELAKKYHVLPVALVLNVPPKVCHERNQSRPSRAFGFQVVRNQSAELRKGLRGLRDEGFRSIAIFDSPEEVDAVTITRQRLWTDKRDESGPFDIIGDIHGCYAELCDLLTALAWTVDAPAHRATPPAGRRAIFLGDLVDRGPDSPSVLKLVMSLVEAGDAFCIPGNHEAKLLKKLHGRDVRLTHGLQQTMDQLAHEPEAFLARAAAFIDGLVSHLVLDAGRLVVAHAGLRADLQGRASGGVREFALYGETTGETDEYGLPVRYNWAEDYRGDATVVYGHTPVPTAEWLNRTICIDTGCVFGGRLTALRYPERTLVDVPARQVWYESVKPLLAPPAESKVPARSGYTLDINDVLGKRIIETGYGRVTIREELAVPALEVMSRFAIDPRWLIYLPPTMAPPRTHKDGPWLEHPSEAFAAFREDGVLKVICEEKHMGSRAIILACRDEAAAARRFGGISGTGYVVSRTGRPFFSDPAFGAEVLRRIRRALDQADLWSTLETDWVLLDAEIMPWSQKASALLRQQYAPTGSAATHGLEAATALLRQAATRGSGDPATDALLAHMDARRETAHAFVEAYRRYCWTVKSISDLKIAPFHVLASEGRVHTGRDHLWHLGTLATLANADPGFFHPTGHRVVDLQDPASVEDATAWWEALTEAGGEGMVVKPLDFLHRGPRGLTQPAIKCRGREYLRIIYGAEYTLPYQLDRLRERGVKAKAALALKELALGLEALDRFVAKEPLYRVHECVFGVLALESEPVDPRL